MTRPPYYISSFGGSATKWLASALSAHPDLVCFHGTRSIPPHPSGTNDLSVEDFARALELLAVSSQHKKTFGAIHGFHGLTAKQAFESRGGRFMAMLRHPIKRIHSLVSNGLELHYGFKGENIYQQALDDPTSNLAIKLADSGQINNVDVDGAVTYIYTICENTFLYDRQILTGLKPDQIIVMEHLVADELYFARLACHLSGNENIARSYLDQVYGAGKIHSHAVSDKSPEDIYRAWPGPVRFLFHLAQSRRFGPDWEPYDQLGYPMPVRPDDFDLEARFLV